MLHGGPFPNWPCAQPPTRKVPFYHAAHFERSFSFGTTKADPLRVFDIENIPQPRTVAIQVNCVTRVRNSFTGDHDLVVWAEQFGTLCTAERCTPSTPSF
jgi:hypothetical protein